MTTCCYFVSLRTGCLIAGAFFIIIAVVKAILLGIYSLPEGAQAVLILNIVFVFFAGILLLLGAHKEDRVCILTFICFNMCAMVLQAVGLLVQYLAVEEESGTIATWILIMMAIEHGPFIYMIPTGFREYRDVKEKHMRLADRLESDVLHGRLHNHHSRSPHSVTVPGLGF